MSAYSAKAWLIINNTTSGELDIQPVMALFVLREFVNSGFFVSVLLELIHVYLQPL